MPSGHVKCSWECWRPEVSDHPQGNLPTSSLKSSREGGWQLNWTNRFCDENRQREGVKLFCNVDGKSLKRRLQGPRGQQRQELQGPRGQHWKQSDIGIKISETVEADELQE